MQHIIGIDLDNTIIDFNDVIFNTAYLLHFIPSEFPKNKKKIRDEIRKLPDGDVKWQKVQEIVYGERIMEAKVFPGVKEFFEKCKKNAIPVYIISHKTEYSNLIQNRKRIPAPPRADRTDMTNLRNRAKEFLITHHIPIENLYFESTRAEKIHRIITVGCSLFIDDLIETFLEPAFPQTVKKILFDPQGEGVMGEDVIVCRSWREIVALKELRIMKDTVVFIKDMLLTQYNEKALSIDPIGSGGNSRVYVVECHNGKKFTAKVYGSNTIQTFDRLKREYESLSFLWNAGVRCIPEPMYADKKHRIALYEYIDGKQINSDGISVKHIDQLLDLVRILKDLEDHPKARYLPKAAEACFSLREIIESIEKRMNRLRHLSNLRDLGSKLDNFIEKEFSPIFNKIVAIAQLSDIAGYKLDRSFQTLSPSDLGFHNAIQRSNGELVFLDFEYFGWDDPAKMISDFLWHPKMNLSETHKKYFKKSMLEIFSEDPDLIRRFEIVHSLYGLKWCLIILNEFVPKDLKRRSFAQGKKTDREKVCLKQLEKARKVLSCINSKIQIPNIKQ